MPLLAVPQLSSCSSSGRAWRLWLARHSQGWKPGHWAPCRCLGDLSEPPPTPPISMRPAIQAARAPSPREATAPWPRGSKRGSPREEGLSRAPWPRLASRPCLESRSSRGLASFEALLPAGRGRMVKVPSQQRPSSHPVPPQSAPGGSWQLGTPRVGSGKAAASGIPAMASGARASRLHGRRCHRL